MITILISLHSDKDKMMKLQEENVYTYTFTPGEGWREKESSDLRFLNNTRVTFTQCAKNEMEIAALLVDGFDGWEVWNRKYFELHSTDEGTYYIEVTWIAEIIANSK